MSWPDVARRGASVSRSDLPSGADLRFPRAARLSARKSFLDIYERGQRVSGPYFVFFAVAGATATSRLGITATKKFGHAVARNRIKRIVRDLFRHHPGSGAPIDLVVNVKGAAAGQDYERLDREFAARIAEIRRKVCP